MQQVKIFIDKSSYHSPSPTTGAALYTLANLSLGQVLYREVTGDRKDPEITNGPQEVHLKVDEHFHTGKPKEYHIIINAQPKTVSSHTLTYEAVVLLAFPVPITGPNIVYTVGYEDGPHENPTGSLTAGGSVKIKDGMIFDVTPTDKS